MKKEITTSCERLEMRIAELISGINEVEGEIRKKPKLRRAITRGQSSVPNLRRQFLTAKLALNEILDHVGRSDDRYRASIGRSRTPSPKRTDPQKHFEGMGG